MKKFKHKETGVILEVDDNVASVMTRFGYEEVKEKETKKKEE